MDRPVDESSHNISLRKFESNKKYKENILREIITIICAMLNSNGGKVVIQFDTDSSIPVQGIPFSQISIVIRILEQHMISITGLQRTASKIHFRDDKDSIIIFIEKAGFFITTNYNLYLPSQTQVVEVSPLEPLENVKNDIMYRKVIPNPIELGSHWKIFRKDEICDLRESKICQLKNLKAVSSKRTTLADRMTGKGNKLTCYVSAFANYSGGHIYYGIACDKVVEGEFVPNEKDKAEITKKVEKVIKKIIWPEQIGQPTQGKEWEIFFEPVVDENSKPVPSTFVIVIYIAPCLGGVFTEEPESYEMVDGKVMKMSFATWKIRSLRPVWLSCKEKIPHRVGRVTWSSDAVRKTFTNEGERLRELINHGNWHAISKLSESFQKESDLHEMTSVVLSKKVTACYRRGLYKTARSFLARYMDILSKVRDVLIFEVLGLHLQAALKRATGDFKGLEENLSAALSKAEMIEPGLVTATVYVFAATVSDLITLEEPKSSKFSPEILSRKALEHLQHVKDCPRFCADKTQRAHIILATFNLGCNLSGKRRENINIETLHLNKAKTSLMAVQQSICDGNPLSWYREIQLNLVQSIYYYRHSQVLSDQRDYFLRSAFDYAKRAECVAKDYQFNEMLEWSKVNKALCTEELVRVKLLELDLQFKIR